jgi:hypothetical protein
LTRFYDFMDQQSSAFFVGLHKGTSIHSFATGKSCEIMLVDPRSNDAKEFGSTGDTLGECRGAMAELSESK